MKFGTNLLLV